MFFQPAGKRKNGGHVKFIAALFWMVVLPVELAFVMALVAASLMAAWQTLLQAGHHGLSASSR